MSNSLFEQILQGHSVPLTELQLGQFEIFCSTQNLPLQKWNDISVLLFQQNRQYCLHFLQYVQRTQISKSIYNDFMHQDNKVRILNNMFALMLTKATKECIFTPQNIDSKSEIDASIAESKKYLTQCQNVKMTTNVVNRAFLEYYEGQLNKATNMFNTVIESLDTGVSNEGRLIAMLGLAQIYFLKRNYSKSLELYKKALSTFKNLPIKARIGMGYCFFYLEKYQMARACFSRILKLDPTCVQAYIGLAVVEQKNQNFIEYFKNLSQAVKVNKKHPLVLIHLAEHFLIKGNLERATKMAQDGLVQVEKMSKFFIKPNKSPQDLVGFRNDYNQLKARFNNILGQVQHIKNNYLQALRYYRLASNPNLIFNQIYLSQVYTQCSNYAQSMQILQKLFKQSSPTTSRFLNDSIKDLAYLKSKNPSLPTQQKTCEQTYNQAIAYNKNDVDVKIELANQILQTKKARALRLLLSVFKIVEQQSGDQNAKPQLVNNIGVLYIENHQYKEALHYLEPCVTRLKRLNDRLNEQRNNNSQKPSNQTQTDGNNSIIPQSSFNNQEQQNFEQQCIKTASNYLVSLFNLGLVKQKLCLFTQALQIYHQILSANKYFIDAHIRIANILFHQGDFRKSIQVLDEALKQSQDKQANFIRLDKVVSMKLYLQKLWGDHVAAKDGVKQIAKQNRDIYSQIFQLSLVYEQLLKRQPQLVVIKEFLRPNRQVYMRACHEDPHNAFCYLVLNVLLLTDKRISLNQGAELFTQLKQHNADQIPIILYNMGLFFLNYDDYQKAKFIFALYKEKTHDERGEELLALANVLEGQYSASIQSVKKNILLNPANVKSRYQLYYATEKKIELERQQQKSRLRSLIPTHLQILRKCHKFYNYFSRLNANDYIKYHESPDMKQLTRTYVQKIRGLCDERKFYVGSNIDYYEKLQKDQMIKAKQQEERERRIKMAQQRIQIQGGKENIDIAGNGAFADQSDSEQIKLRKREEKKRKALEMARKKDQQINQKFEEIKEKEREEREKKLAKMNREPRQKGTKKRQKRPKAQSSEDQVQYESLKSIQNEFSHQSPSEASLEQQDDEIQAPKRKRRQERRQERRERKKKIKKEKLRIEDDEDLNSNPFSDDLEEKKSKKENGFSDDQSEPRKKKKKEEEKPEQEDIDMNQWLL